MEKVRKVVKKYYLRQIITYWLACWMFFGLPAQVAMASMNAGNIVPTSQTPGVDFLNPSGSDITTVIAPHQAIIEYSDFNVDALKTLHFDQALATDAVLNRIVQDSLPSNIYGNITALGRVFIVNPAGIVFYEGASVNVAQLVASGLGMTNQAFLDATDVAQNNKMVFADGAGYVINLGTLDATGTGSLYLVGQNVNNSGHIVCPDGLVVMAAGDEVHLGQPGSDVIVNVANDFTITSNYVDNRTGNGITAKDVVLAAGDIWSGALNVETLRAEAKGNINADDVILASAVASSDAIATIEMSAGGDITIDDSITAKTTADTGVSTDDAISTIKIDAGGSIYVNAHVRAEADAVAGSGNGFTSIDVDAVGDVVMDGGRFSSDAYGDDIGVDLNKSKVEIDATNVTLQNGSSITSDAGKGLENTGDIIIKASQDVTVTDSEIYVELHDSDGSNRATVDITAGGVVNVKSEFNEAKILSWASTGENNSANITITAGSVDVISKYNNDAFIEAYADNGGSNNTDVTITTNGTGLEGGETGDVKVISKSINGKGYAGISAVAENSPTNKTNVKIDATGDVEVIARNGGEAEIRAEAVNWLYIEDDDDIAYSKLINTAGVDIDADGRVKVKAEGGRYEYPSGEWKGSYAAITAKARNIFEIERESTEPVNLTLNGLTNEATVDIDAAKVEVLSYEGAEAEILAEAANILDWDFDEYGPLPFTVNLSGDNINNTALVDIATLAVEDDEQNNGNVLVKADGGDYAGIRADAFNGILELADPETADDLPQNMTNDADVTIDADGEVKVAGYYGEAAVTAFAALGRNNNATVDIIADDDLKVESESGYETEGAGIIEAIAEYGVDNNANVKIITGGKVKVIDEGYSDDTAIIEALAQNALNSNTSDITINAGEDVLVMGKYGGEAMIIATAADPDSEMDNSSSNSANVTVNTEDGDVLVHGIYGHAAIATGARDADDNKATVGINAIGGDVKVIDVGSSDRTAEIGAWAENASNSNTADVQITATATTSECEEDGLVYVDVEGGNVKVAAKDGGHAEITAYAAEAEAEDREVDQSSNSANITIRTNSAEGTTWEQVDPPLYTLGDTPSDEPLEYEEITYTEGGDVELKVENGGKAAIQAVTMRANENDSDVLICAEGEVLVSDKNSQYTTAKITSVAHFGNINNAYTGVRGAEGITVLADSGNASIASKAMYGLIESPAQQNTAFTSLCTDGDVVVAAMNNGTTEVLANAKYGIVNNADVGVCADGDVLVAAGLNGIGGTAKIKAEAEAAYVAPPTIPDGSTGGTTLLVTSVPQEPQEPTSATANTVVVSHNGGVGVIDEKYVSGTATASIEAQAHNSNENNAYVGVAAGADLSPKDLEPQTPPGDYEPPIETFQTNGPIGNSWDYLLDEIMPGNVNVEGRGGSAKASIISKAYQGPVNTAETVVCAPGEVQVLAMDEGGIAQIKSRAGWFGDDESLNDATTRIYASEVYVDVPDIYWGKGIWAYAHGSDNNPRVPDDFLVGILDESYTGDYYDMTEHGEVVYGDGKDDKATLIIQDYSERENCPECLPCPDCDLGGPDEPPIGPPAPLGTAPIPPLQQILFDQGGCPALMEWLANEVGVAVDVQVFLAGAFVSSTDCQPCETAARLKAAATILTDEDGSHMAAMNQVFNELANTLTLSAPFTPEMASSVAAAFTDPANTGAQYAAAREYIDAFVQYIAILNTEMGSPIGDSVAYVMTKYGSDVSGNPIMADFLASRLESGETFAQ